MSEEGRPPCADNPELWFSTHPSEVKAAKALCRICPIRLTCLRDALANREAYGVFGGLTEVERARMHVTTPTTQTCGIAECSAFLPVATERYSAARRYCSPAHAQLASHRAAAQRKAS